MTRRRRRRRRPTLRHLAPRRRLPRLPPPRPRGPSRPRPRSPQGSEPRHYPMRMAPPAVTCCRGSRSRGGHPDVSSTPATRLAAITRQNAPSIAVAMMPKTRSDVRGRAGPPVAERKLLQAAGSDRGMRQSRSPCCAVRRNEEWMTWAFDRGRRGTLGSGRECDHEPQKAHQAQERATGGAERPRDGASAVLVRGTGKLARPAPPPAAARGRHFDGSGRQRVKLTAA